MKSESFVYWLQGYAELAGESGGLSEAQWKCVKSHLALVFRHEIDPSMGPPEKQAELNKIHASLEEALKHESEKPPKYAPNPSNLVMRC